MNPSSTQVSSPYVFQVTAQPTIRNELVGIGAPISDLKSVRLPAALQPGLPGVNDTTSVGTSDVDNDEPKQLTAGQTRLTLIVR